MSEKHRFTAIILESGDSRYVASVPCLPGCHSQGDTTDEALANIREAIELYIEDMSEDEIREAAGLKFQTVEIEI